MHHPARGLNLWSFQGKTRILHLSWCAFFLSFVVWFNHAPLLAAIRDTLGLSDAEIKTLLILNVALTIPARIIVGMVVDASVRASASRVSWSSGGGLCFLFAAAESYRSSPCRAFSSASWGPAS